MPTHSPVTQLLIAAGLALSAAALLPACSSGGSSHAAASRSVQGKDFLASPTLAPASADPPAPVASATLPRFRPDTPAPDSPDRTLTADESADVTSTIGPAPSGPVVANTATALNAPASAAGIPLGSVVVLESLVGQINGRPVFASEILEPLDGRLRAIAEKARNPRQWQADAAKEISNELIRLVNNELILAEARSSLSVEQKAGLLNFLNHIQETVVAQQRGSEVAADEALRTSTGRGLAETSRDKLDQALIGEELRNRVNNRVIVSWRQIQQEYERNFDKYNPDPKATFRIIEVAASKPEQVESIRTRLAAGEPFANVADSDANGFGKGDKNKLDKAFKQPLDQAKFFDAAPLNKAARALSTGAFAGPVEFQGSQYWLYLEQIDQPPAVSLYDAQLEIEGSLHQKRFTTETSRYFDRLRRRGSVSNIEDMITRLLIIANDRYWNSKG